MKCVWIGGASIGEKSGDECDTSCVAGGERKLIDDMDGNMSDACVVSWTCSMKQGLEKT